MFQVLQDCDNGDAHDDVSQRHLVDKYQSFYETCFLHYQCRISQSLILISKLITAATDSWWLQTVFFTFCHFQRDAQSRTIAQVTSTCTDVKLPAFHTFRLYSFDRIKFQ